jgi:hypothetical protein
MNTQLCWQNNDINWPMNHAPTRKVPEPPSSLKAKERDSIQPTKTPRDSQHKKSRQPANTGQVRQPHERQPPPWQQQGQYHDKRDKNYETMEYNDQ